MAGKQFEYGPVARGIYIALISGVFLVAWVVPGWLVYYIGFLLFLGLGLRPLLERSGVAHHFFEVVADVDDRLHRKRELKRRAQIERQQRDKKYKHSHYRDPKLPPRW